MMAMGNGLSFTLFNDRYAVVRLSPGTSIPTWAFSGELSSLTVTPEEISIVCTERGIPDDVRAERGWRCLRLEGPIPFETTGVAAGFASVLAAESISIFIISTFDTDYLLVKHEVIERSINALRANGYDVSWPS
jgi:hypothetical protein